MTFSIVVRGADQTSFGVAVASKFLAVGSAVPAAAAGVGALATQSFANLAYRSQGLELLQHGCDAGETVRQLIGPDEERERRQVGVVDSHGGAAAFTGRECHDWAGHRTGPDYAIQGNLLVGPQVLEEVERAWLAGVGTPLAGRLLDALQAGDDVGGDRRGRQSAALFVVSPGTGYGGTSDVFADLRVDDHERPIPELRRLLELHELYFTPADPSTLLDLTGETLTETSELLSRVGQPPNGTDPTAVHAALSNWAGVENVEMRVPDRPAIDPIVLRLLRQKAAAR